MIGMAGMSSLRLTASSRERSSTYIFSGFFHFDDRVEVVHLVEVEVQVQEQLARLGVVEDKVCQQGSLVGQTGEQ